MRPGMFRLTRRPGTSRASPGPGTRRVGTTRWPDVPMRSFSFITSRSTTSPPYAEGTATRVEHLKDIEDLFAALRTGNVPAVAFVKPIGAHNEHPGYADLLRGQQYVATLVKAVQDSAVWKNSVIIITYDEGGDAGTMFRHREAIAGAPASAFRRSSSRPTPNAA